MVHLGLFFGTVLIYKLGASWRDGEVAMSLLILYVLSCQPQLCCIDLLEAFTVCLCISLLCSPPWISRTEMCLVRMRLRKAELTTLLRLLGEKPPKVCALLEQNVMARGTILEHTLSCRIITSFWLEKTFKIIHSNH